MGLLGKLLGTDKFSAATNALLAEHLISTLSTHQKSELRAYIPVVFSHAGLSMSEDQALNKFNRDSRFEQLNILAMALNEMGFEPNISGEFWQEVRNPYMPGLDNPSHVEAVRTRLKKSRGVDVSIGAGSLDILSW